MASRRGKPGGPAAPRVEPPDLTDLVAGDRDQLVELADLDGFEWSDLDGDALDVGGGRLLDCWINGARTQTLGLSRTRLISTRLEAIDTPVVAASRSEWRDVAVAGSRLGSAELFDGQWRSVLFADCRLGYLNGRSASWHDVVFRQCRIGELDLSMAGLERVAFEDCEIDVLTVTGARLVDVDLRGAELALVHGITGLAGATIDSTQLSLLAPLFAGELGISVS